MRMERHLSLAVFLFASLLLGSCGQTGPTGDSSLLSSSHNSEDSSSSSSSSSPEGDETRGLIYRLDFSAPDSLGKNALDDTDYPDAILISNGGLSLDENRLVKGLKSLKFSGSGTKKNYLSLPAQLLDQESITIAGFFYVPNDITNKSVELSFANENSFFSSSPYDSDCWWGYNMRTNLLGNEASLTCPSADSSACWHTATSGEVQPVYGTFYHLAYEFGKEHFSVYQNGSLILRKDGDFSLKNRGFSSFYLGSDVKTSNTKDYNGEISDFRVYDALLDESDLKKEYALTSSDFLTSEYDFESAKENIRGFDATSNGTPQYVQKDGRDCLYLDGSEGTETTSRTSLSLPSTSLMGHHHLSISTDIYIVNTGKRYQRIFDFSIGGQRYLALYVGFAATNDLKAEFTNYASQYRDVLTDSDYVVPTEKWINITLTMDGEKGTLYVDGLPIATNDKFAYNPETFWYYPDLKLDLGRTDFYGDSPLTAYFDDFRIWASALEEKEVMEMNGVITLDDDQEAVDAAYEKLDFAYQGGMKISLPSYGAEGVKLAYHSSDESLLGDDGWVYPQEEEKDVTLQVSLSRGEAEKEKSFVFTIAKRGAVGNILEDPSLEDLSFEDNSNYASLMLANLDYMFTLDMDRLLYNYRRIAGLDTKNAKSYGGWISPTTNGAGQFEAMYVSALARYCLSEPSYVGKDGSTPLSRLSYLVAELRKSQLAFAANNPAEAGYLSAFSIQAFKVIRTGGTALGDGTYAWVPYYMLHKNLAACLDVVTYCPDENVKETAKSMLKDACDWTYQELSGMSSTELANVLNFEFGGMTEVLYQSFALFGEKKYLQCARYFEQRGFLDNLYNDVNVLPNLHANTTIPKILGCAAAYQVTGDVYYKTICVNFWAMIQKMAYANGGIGLNEFFEEEGHTSEGNYSEETCCSYNMFKLCEYLFRWTGDSEYADYYENVIYNQILCSMDPATGGKTYPISTTFGFYKVYSSAEDSFWCCCCTGMESFSKLTLGEYYESKGADGVTSLSVNLYAPMSYKVSDSLTLVQSGDFMIDEKTRLTIVGRGSLLLRLRVPSWSPSSSLTLNGQALLLTPKDGYLELERDFEDGDSLVYALPMDYHLDSLKGKEGTYALKYGPLLLVAELGDEDVQDIQANQTSFGTGYMGDKVDYVIFSNEDYQSHLTRSVVSSHLHFVMDANNQTLDFIPFVDCLHERYAMYLDYYFDGEDLSKLYEIEGTKTSCLFNEESDLDLFTEYKTSSLSSSVQDGALSIADGMEYKALLNGVSLSGDFEVGADFAPQTADGKLNTGIYLFAGNASSNQDGIDALNVQVEKAQGSSTYTLSVFKFTSEGGYEGLYHSLQTSLPFKSQGFVNLRALVKGGTLYVFADGREVPSLKCDLSGEYQGGGIGIRSQFAASNVDNFYYLH